MMPLLVRWLHPYFIQLQNWYQQSIPVIIVVELFMVTAPTPFLSNFFSFLFGSRRVAICPLSPRDHIVDIQPLYQGAFNPSM